MHRPPGEPTCLERETYTWPPQLSWPGSPGPDVAFAAQGPVTVKQLWFAVGLSQKTPGQDQSWRSF